MENRRRHILYIQPFIKYSFYFYCIQISEFLDNIVYFSESYIKKIVLIENQLNCFFLLLHAYRNLCSKSAMISNNLITLAFYVGIILSYLQTNYLKLYYPLIKYISLFNNNSRYILHVMCLCMRHNYVLT